MTVLKVLLTLFVTAWLVQDGYAAGKKQPPRPQPPQTMCAPLAEFQTAIKAKYGETPVMAGMASGGKIFITMLANSETGTWTLLAVSTKGIACAFGSGTDYVHLIPGRAS